MFTSEGQLKVYDDWYITINPTCDIGKYYRYLYNYENRARIKIQKPKWNSHVTIIRQEEPLLNKDKWQEQDGKIFEFQYENEVITGIKHVWIDIYCLQANDLRVFFGLNKYPVMPFHLTIGYIEDILNKNWYEENRIKRE